MVYETGSFEAAISAAAGNDAALRTELRDSYRQSLEHQFDLISRARCDGNWQVAAQRLRSLGASFHDGHLVQLSELALDGAPGDPAILREISRHAGRLFRSE